MSAPARRSQGLQIPGVVVSYKPPTLALGIMTPSLLQRVVCALNHGVISAAPNFQFLCHFTEAENVSHCVNERLKTDQCMTFLELIGN